MEILPEVCNVKGICWFLALLLLLSGCGAPVQTVDMEEEAVALSDAPAPAVGVVLEPEAPGLLEARCDEAVVDYSHTEDGYVMVRFTGETEKRLKVRIKGPKTTYDIMGSLAQGKTVRVTGQVFKHGSKACWVQVDYNGKTGYVCTDYLK